MPSTIRDQIDEVAESQAARVKMKSLLKWFGIGFLGGVAFALIRNPLGCLIWLVILTIVAGLIGYIIVTAVPGWALFLIAVAALVAICWRAVRRSPQVDEPGNLE